MSPSRAIVTIVRRAGLSDLNQLVSMCREHASFERSLVGAPDGLRLQAALFCASPRLHAWIAAIDGEPVGYATATVDFSTWRAREFMHLDCLFVREPVRGVGIGRRLLDSVRATAHALGLDQLQWQTPGWNVSAQRFYSRAGAVASKKIRYTLDL